jgi:hypothetical protein
MASPTKESLAQPGRHRDTLPKAGEWHCSSGRAQNVTPVGGAVLQTRRYVAIYGEREAEPAGEIRQSPPWGKRIRANAAKCHRGRH